VENLPARTITITAPDAIETLYPIEKSRVCLARQNTVSEVQKHLCV
jgi:hypothetical protein